MNILEIDHVGIVVPSLDGAVQWLQDALGLVAGAVAVSSSQGVRIRFVEVGHTRLELLEPEKHNASLRRFLDRHPRGGLHHVSLAVGKLDGALQTLRLRGVPLSGNTGRTIQGRPMCFLRPPSELGVLFELEEHGVELNHSVLDNESLVINRRALPL